MKPTEFSLRNPLAVVAITVTIALFGLYAYGALGVGIAPNVNIPELIVTTTDPGADPATVETEITKPLEDAISTLQNIDTLTSTSSEGVSTIIVVFTNAANPDLVTVDVERVVNSVRSNLPAEADAPSIVKADPNTVLPAAIVTLSGPQPLVQLRRTADDQVKRALEAVSGVGSVQLTGGPKREIWVKADTARLQARGLGLNSLEQALRTEQLERPAGSLTDATKDTSVRLSGLVARPSDLGRIVVAQTPAAAVYVDDVATIEDTHAKTTAINRLNGQPAVTLTAYRLPSANVIEVARAVREKVAALQPALPDGMRLDVVLDGARYTRQSFDTIQHTLLEAIVMTGLILLVFLHTWRSTAIVLVSIPTSILTTFGLMLLLGLTLNLFTMLALTLAVGILVDDSMVVIENISRHLELGAPPYLAAVRGRSEIGLAAITITLVDVVVYVPIALMPGLSGQLIGPFALVMAAATLTSLLVSFTLTPLLASRFIRAHSSAAGTGIGGRFAHGWDAAFERLASTYRRVLRAALSRNLVALGRRPGGGPRIAIGMRWLVIASGLLAMAAGVAVLGTGRIGLDIFPSGDQSEVDVTVVMPSATALEQTDVVTGLLQQRLRRYPEVDKVYSASGAGSVNPFFGLASGDTANLYVLLRPPDERAGTSAEFAERLRRELAAGVPGAKLRIALPNAFGFGGFGGQPIQVKVRGPDPDILDHLVGQAAAAVRSVPGAVDVNTSNEVVAPQVVVVVDRDRAADLGVTAQAAAGSLQAAVDGIKVSKFRRPGQEDVDIRLIAGDRTLADPRNLGRLPLLSPTGRIVSLDQIGTLVRGTAPVSIAHVSRDRSVTINASAAGRTVGSVQSDVEHKMQEIALPAGYSISYAGQAQQGGQAFGDMFRALAIGILLMYLLMTLLFGSAVQPLAVLVSLPLAIVGSIGAMAITETPFTLFSMIGFAVLLGLVGKNAILLVDYTDTLRKRGKSRLEALVEAGPTRLRPIVMTTVSIIAALLPLAAGVEEASDLLKAAALVLIGGLITSTLLTLLFVPAMYTIFDDVREAAGRLVRRVSSPRELEPEELALLRGHLSAVVAPAAFGAGNGAHAPHFASEAGSGIAVD